MYEKNLNKCVRLRLSEEDFNFCVRYAENYNISVSEVIRYFIGSYRRDYSSILFNEGDYVHGYEKADV